MRASCIVAREAGAASIVDADGAVLTEALPARPDVIKPNAAELVAATGLDDRRRAIAWLRARGAGAVVATSGPDGLTADTPLGSWRGWLDEALLAVNPTGAGDACTAAVAAGLVAGRDWPAMLEDAVAWSAAAVLAPVAGEIDMDTVARMRPSVRVEELHDARIDG